ncbi:hypothetical protein QQF64_019787 [Cirrhinus molitorella]|uniref:Ig-like domain-containing protein n=1 Tax=Cirrhinus molitorella TaxID=172907 RepID=A0ABR3LGH9_9TELE
MSGRFWFCLSLWRLLGVFADSDEVKSVSVMEGDSVTLESGLTEIQTDDLITWKFGDPEDLIAGIILDEEIFDTFDLPDGRFRDRLELDHQSGSLTITNTRTTDSGLYHVMIITDMKLTTYRFNVTVYAHLPVPDISSYYSSNCLSSCSYCSLLCSVVNVSRVTLSWYKETGLLSSVISVSDLSITVSLHLEVEYEDNHTYSCVINNPISNQTQHLDISKLCPGAHLTNKQDSFSCCDSAEAVIRLVATALVGVAAAAAIVVLVYDIRSRRAEQNV